MKHNDEGVDLQRQCDKLEDRLEIALQELENAQAELKQPPEWGGCRRGCPESYLDKQGFCSPACHWGAPKGQHVTVAQPAGAPA